MKSITIFLIITLLYSCKPNYTTNHLRTFIGSTLKKNNGIINLRLYNENEWNKLYVLGPYSSKNSFDANLKVYEQQILQTGIENVDDRCILLLFNDDKLADISIINRVIDFSNAAKNSNSKVGFYTKNASLFHYRKKDNHTFIMTNFD